MIEIEKNKIGKCLVISVFTLPDDDELIKRPFYILTHPNAPPFRFGRPEQKEERSNEVINGGIESHSVNETSEVEESHW